MYEEYVPENEFRVVDEDHMGYIKTLQVAQFPLISCRRLVNGLFRFENSNVTLIQYMENNFENDVEAMTKCALLLYFVHTTQKHCCVLLIQQNCNNFICTYRFQISIALT